MKVSDEKKFIFPAHITNTYQPITIVETKNPTVSFLFLEKSVLVNPQ